ncbi:inosine-5'-monophosphate dehydrogenase [Candidatus Riesia pediculicola USDA]|uniref:Inosine-5'-monophosphate dehydrogenase n=1 Tax=Riesia pediculicola (strain USDA) TaxID=515618 RepID=D4G7S3_RIEPU|nr:IMP dehydrogenase [Candidatus Riesia pediculicola]ADD79450.1 inosine-5'-monophosphate dehydrogenase [Candidatus Riesia pediculicola USDA]
MLRIKKKKGLTFDDVLLTPSYSKTISNCINLSTYLTKKIQLKIPIVSAAMDTVTGSELSIELAKIGGMGFIHRNMTIRKQSEEIRKVKNYQIFKIDDQDLCSELTILHVFRLVESKNFLVRYKIRERQFISLKIVKNINFPKSIDHSDCKIFFRYHINVFQEKEKCKYVFNNMIENHSKYAVIIDVHRNIKGMFLIEINSKEENLSFCQDSKGRLRVGAAISANENDDRIRELIKSEVDAVLIDSSHGHSDTVLKKVFEIKKKYPNLPIIGGNVATPEGALDLVQAGADAVKVGIGPGSICTTRIVTGVGIPQITAISESADALLKTQVPVIADGGIKFSGDIGKAIAAGAKCVMLGSILASSQESIGKLVIYKDKFYKIYRGMGSRESMINGSYDRYLQLKDVNKLVPEGVKGQVLYQGTLKEIVNQMIGGLRSCMRLTGCNNIDQLQTNTKFILISQSGIKENHAHGINLIEDSYISRNHLDIFKLM